MSPRAASDVAKWQTMPMLAFDTETTGINVHEDRIVSACVVEFQPGQRPQARNWLLNPGIEIPAEATAVHGITTAHAREHGQDPEVALFELGGVLASWMGKGFPVVGFNAAYDLTISETENRRHGAPTLRDRLGVKPIGPVIDAMVLDKQVDPYRKGICAEAKKPCGCGAVNKTLAGCCLHYGVPLVSAHSAESDAASAVRLARAIIKKHPNRFRGFSVGSLHQAQVGWRRTQMDGLREYFDKVGTVHDGCDGGWPIMSAPSAVAS